MKLSSLKLESHLYSCQDTKFLLHKNEYEKKNVSIEKWEICIKYATVAMQDANGVFSQ